MLRITLTVVPMNTENGAATPTTAPGSPTSASPRPTDPQKAPGAPSRVENLATTAFPVLVILGGIVGFFAPAPVLAFKEVVPTTILLGIVMFCMGVTLTLPDFARIAKRPWITVLAALMQYGIMPFLAWVIALVLQLPTELMIGLVLVGCVPGGTASNVITYLAKGDVALSVTATSVSTLLAPLMTPMLLLWIAGSELEVGFMAMFTSILQTVLLPVVAGVVVRMLLSRVVDAITPALPWASALVIALILATVVAGSKETILSAGLLVLLAVFFHNALGMALGWGVSKLVGLSAPERRALAFEVGLQNSGLAATLATTFISPLAALPGAVTAFWANIAASLLATFWSKTEPKD
ncbi:bile acid:sodium symporter family protein [Brevibacterium samyangense]|uniref:Bile acid:sodium symporter family protein n=2 Tax=Brevibacterium samyangense TaxID=366888 RepID=A0ABN2TLI7_9MICO